MEKKQWSDLNPTQQRLAVAFGVAEAVLTAVALRDLSGRKADDVRGPKIAWRLACFVQPIGPVTYLVLGRRSTKR